MRQFFQPRQYLNRTTGITILRFMLSIVLCLSAGIIGSFFTAQSVDSWYLLIQKPPITPPGWVFAPVWSVLYVLMGISFFLVWRQNLQSRAYRDALTVFIFQLLLNILWSMVFFGFRSIAGGLVVIVLLSGAIIRTMKIFFPFSRAASLLLLPYLIWVGYALVLNSWIFMLNG
ncbi:MAG: tryptophan-rich sensory protein [Deltaproteobacteria bacterium]|nr:tryptophan-rich sensory protein [Deltaproteobacteria bacterium]